MAERDRKPTVEDVDPDAMAVNSSPDELRTHAGADETDAAQIGDGSVAPVPARSPEDEDEDEDDSAS